ncbi:MAG: stage V sporulation protein AD [Firmicutes bacterium]|nr:stage V sporulation protein AD [Bacillota bacterium]
MASKKIGKATVKFINPPVIIGTGTVVGPMEGRGPLAEDFDVILPDLTCGEKTAERSERKILEQAAQIAIERSGIAKSMIDYYIAGDLLNQIISASFSARQLAIPFLGVYGACSTCAMGTALGGMIIDGGFADYVLIACSSHYQTAERQFRYPIELNVQHKPTSQYTVTGAGALVLASSGNGARVTWATTGKVIDLGIKDPYNLGAAMAPAAADTLLRHVADTGHGPDAYDLILTGDLGRLGSELFRELTKDAGCDCGNNHNDCGLMIFDTKTQRVGAGASGCACPAVITLGHVLREMERGKLKRVLLIATGALLSPLSSQQGETIPGVGHAIVIEW